MPDDDYKTKLEQFAKGRNIKMIFQEGVRN